jgi:hypothetical protein
MAPPRPAHFGMLDISAIQAGLYNGRQHPGLYPTRTAAEPKEALIYSTKLSLHPKGINERSTAISQFIINRLEIASLPKGIL